MNTAEISDCSIHKLSKLITSGEVSSTEIVEACMKKTTLLNPKLNAFVHFDEDEIYKQATELDELTKKGTSLGPLHGIPFAIKDNYFVNGMPTTACSNTRSKENSTKDSIVVTQLKSSGAMIFGKTNMHEWAYGATSEISSEGAVKNPWNPKHITAGSSGGSAAALAAQLVPAAMGSDTGGSIRMPASACGICGLKPTFGRVSTDGVLPLSWSMDVAGPMARTAKDLSIIFKIIKNNNQTNILNNQLKDSSTDSLLGKLAIAVPEGNRLEFSDEVGTVFNQALDVFHANGSNINRITIDNMLAGFSAWNIILHAEATTYHSQTMKENNASYSEDIRNHLEAGNYIPAVSYLKAQQYRRIFNDYINGIFKYNHIIAIPTLPITAPLMGKKDVSFAGVKVSTQDAMTYLAWFANFTGLPAISIPCGISTDGMPIGISLIASAGNDEMLLDIGCAIQSITAWHLKRPKL